MTGGGGVDGSNSLPSPDTAVHVAISWARRLLPAMVWALFLTLGRNPTGLRVERRKTHIQRFIQEKKNSCLLLRQDKPTIIKLS